MVRGSREGVGALVDDGAGLAALSDLFLSEEPPSDVDPRRIDLSADVRECAGIDAAASEIDANVLPDEVPAHPPQHFADDFQSGLVGGHPVGLRAGLERDRRRVDDCGGVAEIVGERLADVPGQRARRHQERHLALEQKVVGLRVRILDFMPPERGAGARAGEVLELQLRVAQGLDRVALLQRRTQLDEHDRQLQAL